MEGRQRTLSVRCLCGLVSICMRCTTLAYWNVRKELPGQHFFCTWQGWALSARAVASAFGDLPLATLRGRGPARPHSARVTGSRFWISQGLSLDEVACLGLWSDQRTLLHYLGAAAQILKLQLGLEERKRAREVHTMLSEITRRWGASQAPPATNQGQPAPPPASVTSTIGIVMRRTPRRWHVANLSGPSTGWHTRCGHVFNHRTMTLQCWAEQQATDPTCHSCMSVQ